MPLASASRTGARCSLHRCRRSGVLLHDDPRALNFVEIKPGHGGHLRRRRVRCLDIAENLTLGAQQDDAPAALHPTGELGGGVFLAGSAGHSGKYSPCPALDRVGQNGPMADYTHTIDRWDEATGENLIERIAGVSDFLVALETYRAAVKRWPGAKITLRNRARVIEQSWED